MPARKCPYCKVVSNFSPIWNQAPPGEGSERIEIEQCQNCQNYVYYRLPSHGTIEVLDIYPPLETEPDETLPDAVKIALREAYSVLDGKNWNACVLMCRRALEEAVNSLGANGDNLRSKIDDLAGKQKITPDLKEWAHETRLGGNLGAHGSAGQSWATENDAEEILEFTKWFMRYAYVLPRQLSERRGQISEPSA